MQALRQSKLHAFCFAQHPKSGLGRLIFEVSRSHTHTHTHTSYDSSERLIITLQSPLPTQRTTNERHENS